MMRHSVAVGGMAQELGAPGTCYASSGLAAVRQRFLLHRRCKLSYGPLAACLTRTLRNCAPAHAGAHCRIFLLISAAGRVSRGR